MSIPQPGPLSAARTVLWRRVIMPLCGLIVVCLLHGCSQVIRIGPDQAGDARAFAYSAHVSKKIEIIGASRYPQLTQMIKQRDTIELRIRIHRTGRLESVSLRQPASDERLNRLMLELIEYSAPYPPFPDELKADVIEIHKRWHFSVAAPN